MLNKLDPRQEPISVSTLATALAWVGVRFGLGWDDDTATALATIVFVVGGYVARSLSVPAVKHDRIVKDIKQAR